MLMHVFGKVDSPCCSNWALRQGPLKTDISLENVINRNVYMDNLLKSLSTEEDIKNFAMSLIYSLGICGFRLTKWFFNSHNVLSSSPPSELSPKIVNLDLSSQPTERASGMSWDMSMRLLFPKLSKRICLRPNEEFLV